MQIWAKRINFNGRVVLPLQLSSCRWAYNHDVLWKIKLWPFAATNFSKIMNQKSIVMLCDQHNALLINRETDCKIIKSSWANQESVWPRYIRLFHWKYLAIFLTLSYKIGGRKGKSKQAALIKMKTKIPTKNATVEKAIWTSEERCAFELADKSPKAQCQKKG